MIDYIRSNESIQVLVFIVLPLLLLLLTVIVLLFGNRPRTRAIFPTFSVEITMVTYRDGYIAYFENETRTEFVAELELAKSFYKPGIFHVCAPDGMSDEDQQRIIPNLARGLKELKRRFVIYRRGELQVVPEDEQANAVAELQILGAQIKQAAYPGQDEQKAVVIDIRNSVRQSREPARAFLSRVQVLMAKTGEARRSLEVLARSEE